MFLLNIFNESSIMLMSILNFMQISYAHERTIAITI